VAPHELKPAAAAYAANSSESVVTLEVAR